MSRLQEYAIHPDLATILMSLPSLMFLPFIINSWLVQSVTVSEIQNNWRVWAWQVRLVCAVEIIELWNWASELLQEASMGSSVQWGVWWRSKWKSCIHRIIKAMLRTPDADIARLDFIKVLSERIKNDKPCWIKNAWPWCFFLKIVPFNPKVLASQKHKTNTYVSRSTECVTSWVLCHNQTQMLSGILR